MAKIDESTQTNGGQGDTVLNDPAHLRADARMVRRAIEERWPLPPACKVKLLNRLFKIIDEEADHGPLPIPEHREVIAAAKAILAADKINIENEKLILASQEAEPLDAVPLNEQQYAALREAFGDERTAQAVRHGST